MSPWPHLRLPFRLGSGTPCESWIPGRARRHSQSTGPVPPQTSEWTIRGVVVRSTIAYLKWWEFVVPLVNAESKVQSCISPVNDFVIPELQNTLAEWVNAWYLSPFNIPSRDWFTNSLKQEGDSLRGKGFVYLTSKKLVCFASRDTICLCTSISIFLRSCSLYATYHLDSLVFPCLFCNSMNLIYTKSELLCLSRDKSHGEMELLQIVA